MRKLSQILLTLVTTMSAQWLPAQEFDCLEFEDEPFIKFLDDLACFPCGKSSLNPYEDRIETDRHDFTQSTKTVGKGVTQFEFGYTYFYNDQEDETANAHTTPEGMVRLGLSDDIEMRLRWTYTWEFIDVLDNEDSAQDVIWTFKFGVTDECGWIPESAFELRSSLPTGGSNWTRDKMELGFDYIYGWEIREGWELYGSTGYLGGGLGDFGLQPEEPASENFGVWTQSVALGTALNERSVLYNEVFALVSDGLEDEFTVAFYNAGVDFYVTDDFVLDFRIGVGLTDDADDLFTGIGAGIRF